MLERPVSTYFLFAASEGQLGQSNYEILLSFMSIPRLLMVATAFSHCLS
jgi:hypothetical protein